MVAYQRHYGGKDRLKLMVSSYNNGGSTYNEEVEETALRSYKINHDPNTFAEAEIVLADPIGTINQKYNADSNDVYVGPGKVTIEDPNDTDLFFGRIVRAESNFQDRTVTLYCRGWLDQLDEEQIDYDMREDLDGAGLRQSEIKSDVDDECEPVTQTFIYAVADDGGAQTDETDEANDDTADDMTLLPATPAVNDAYYFGFDNKEDYLLLDISTAGAGTWTLTWEYSNNIGTFSSLSGVSDATNGFTESGENKVTWNEPAGAAWQTKVVDGKDKYWVRARVSAYTSITTQPLGKQAWLPQTLYDDDMNWGNDDYNNMYLIFPNDNAGAVTITTGPYADTVDANVTDDGGFDDVWVDDTNKHETAANDTELQIDYDFHINAELGSIYSAGPTKGQIKLKYMLKTAEADVTRTGYIRIKSAAEAYTTIHQILFTDDTDQIRTVTIDIPAPQLNGFVDTAGEATIQLAADVGFGNNTTLEVYQCLLMLDYELTGLSDKHLITDTVATNEIETEGNLTYKGIGCFEGMKYCIAKEIYKHIDTAEGGTLITGGDDIVPLTCAATIEHTSGISTRQYKDRTRLEILQDLAIQDKAMFWGDLGGTTVTWKSTFDSGAPTAIGDANVLNWISRFDYSTMVNNARVYGGRIGSNQLFSESDNTTSQAKYIATRSKTIRNSGLMAEYDTDAIGTALVDRDGDVLQVLSATIQGLDSTYRLGTEVSVTSSWLNLSSVAYVVVRWAYDSETNISSITLTPRSSLSTKGQQPIDAVRTKLNKIDNQVSTTQRDLYVPDNASNTVI